jgi:hypothetical protein
MNLSEQIAYDWLLEQGAEASDIVFRARGTPDFIVAGDRGYEVKRLYGNTIRFTTGQTDKLLEYENAEVLVVDKESVVGRIDVPTLSGWPAAASGYNISYEEGAAARSIVKLPKPLIEQGKELHRHIERYGWDSLGPELQRFFHEGPTLASVFEAAVWLLEQRLCSKKGDGDA